jgi:alanine dehydrogenase
MQSRVAWDNRPPGWQQVHCMEFSTDTLLIPRRRVAELAKAKDYLSTMRSAFEGLARGAYALHSIGHIACGDGGFHIKSALGTAGCKRVAIKINGNFPANAARHGLPTIQGFLALLDAQQGTVLALMDSIEITACRTAAATAVAVELLARKDSEVLGIVGCGVQAYYHVRALLDVAGIRSVRFCEPRDEAALAFRNFLDGIGVECRRVSDPQDAVRGADIIVTLTTSTRPILSSADIAPGTFVAGVGADSPSKNELAPDLLRASRVVPDLLAQASIMGDLHHAIECGAMTPADVHAELADVVAGTASGRTSPSERFVFDSTGIAMQDLAAAEMIYERAMKTPGQSLSIALNDVRAEPDRLLGV